MIYSHSNFKMYNTAVLTVVTMLCITSLRVIYLITESLCLFDNFHTFCPCPAPPPPVWQPHICCFYQVFVFFLKFHIKVIAYSICFSVCLYFTQYNTLRSIQIVMKVKISFFFWMISIPFHFFIHASVAGHLGCFHVLIILNNVYNKHDVADVSFRY